MFPKAALVRGIIALAALLLWCQDACAAGALPVLAWWAWPLLLFVVCFVLGIIAVPAGVGGGVLFVPIVSGFFPFHLDFVRGTGLLVALASAVASSPALLRIGLANLRLALPLALLVSASSIVGAYVGLMLPASVSQTALGLTILGIVLLMWRSRNAGFPVTPLRDPLAHALRMAGVFHDVAKGRQVAWAAHRSAAGCIVFLVIGLLAGMFGLGAGWANVPALNLLMGIPLKVAAGSSSLILSMTSSAAWVYLNKGAVLPMIAIPAILGMMLGAFIGSRVLRAANAAAIRKLVMVMLLFAGLRALEKGLGF